MSFYPYDNNTLISPAMDTTLASDADLTHALTHTSDVGGFLAKLDFDHRHQLMAQTNNRHHLAAHLVSPMEYSQQQAPYSQQRDHFGNLVYTGGAAHHLISPTPGQYEVLGAPNAAEIALQREIAAHVERRKIVQQQQQEKAAAVPVREGSPPSQRSPPRKQQNISFTPQKQQVSGGHKPKKAVTTRAEATHHTTYTEEHHSMQPTKSSTQKFTNKYVAPSKEDPEDIANQSKNNTAGEISSVSAPAGQKPDKAATREKVASESPNRGWMKATSPSSRKKPHRCIQHGVSSPSGDQSVQSIKYHQRLKKNYHDLLHPPTLDTSYGGNSSTNRAMSYSPSRQQRPNTAPTMASSKEVDPGSPIPASADLLVNQSANTSEILNYYHDAQRVYRDPFFIYTPFGFTKAEEPPEEGLPSTGGHHGHHHGEPAAIAHSDSDSTIIANDDEEEGEEYEGDLHVIDAYGRGRVMVPPPSSSSVIDHSRKSSGVDVYFQESGMQYPEGVDLMEEQPDQYVPGARRESEGTEGLMMSPESAPIVSQVQQPFDLDRSVVSQRDANYFESVTSPLALSLSRKQAPSDLLSDEDGRKLRTGAEGGKHNANILGPLFHSSDSQTAPVKPAGDNNKRKDSSAAEVDASTTKLDSGRRHSATDMKNQAGNGRPPLSGKNTGVTKNGSQSQLQRTQSAETQGKGGKGVTPAATVASKQPPKSTPGSKTVAQAGARVNANGANSKGGNASKDNTATATYRSSSGGNNDAEGKGASKDGHKTGGQKKVDPDKTATSQYDEYTYDPSDDDGSSYTGSSSSSESDEDTSYTSSNRTPSPPRRGAAGKGGKAMMQPRVLLSKDVSKDEFAHPDAFYDPPKQSQQQLVQSTMQQKPRGQIVQQQQRGAVQGFNPNRRRATISVYPTIGANNNPNNGLLTAMPYMQANPHPQPNMQRISSTGQLLLNRKKQLEQYQNYETAGIQSDKTLMLMMHNRSLSHLSVTKAPPPQQQQRKPQNPPLREVNYPGLVRPLNSGTAAFLQLRQEQLQRQQQQPHVVPQYLPPQGRPSSSSNPTTPRQAGPLNQAPDKRQNSRSQSSGAPSPATNNPPAKIAVPLQPSQSAPVFSQNTPPSTPAALTMQQQQANPAQQPKNPQGNAAPVPSKQQQPGRAQSASNMFPTPGSTPQTATGGGQAVENNISNKVVQQQPPPAKSESFHPPASLWPAGTLPMQPPSVSNRSASNNTATGGVKPPVIQFGAKKMNSLGGGPMPETAAPQPTGLIGPGTLRPAGIVPRPQPLE